MDVKSFAQGHSEQVAMVGSELRQSDFRIYPFNSHCFIASLEVVLATVVYCNLSGALKEYHWRLIVIIKDFNLDNLYVVAIRNVKLGHPLVCNDAPPSPPISMP